MEGVCRTRLDVHDYTRSIAGISCCVPRMKGKGPGIDNLCPRCLGVGIGVGIGIGIGVGIGVALSALALASSAAWGTASLTSRAICKRPSSSSSNYLSIPSSFSARIFKVGTKEHVDNE